MSRRADRNAAHSPDWLLQHQGHPKIVTNRFATPTFRTHPLSPGASAKPSGPDGEGQARGQALDARGETSQHARLITTERYCA
jgi:hypothetical protein